MDLATCDMAETTFRDKIETKYDAGLDNTNTHDTESNMRNIT